MNRLNGLAFPRAHLRIPLELAELDHHVKDLVQLEDAGQIMAKSYHIRALFAVLV